MPSASDNFAQNREELTPSDDLFDPAAGVLADDVRGLFPLIPSRTTTVAARFPSSYPREGHYSSWQQLFREGLGGRGRAGVDGLGRHVAGPVLRLRRPDAAT